MTVRSLIRAVEDSHNRVARENRRNSLLKSSDNFEEKIEYYIEDLFYEKKTNKLNFKIMKETRKPKITRYVQHNYERTPIYGDVSVRVAIIKNFARVISPIRFLEEEILNLNYLNKEFIYKIIDEVDVVPKWRQKEIKLDNILSTIKNKESQLRNYTKEKLKYYFRNTTAPERAGNFWLRFFLGFFTFFLSFLGYISKSKSKENKRTNKENRIWNKKHEENVNIHNKKLIEEIEEENNNLEKEIETLLEKYHRVENQEIKLISADKDDWINVKEASIFKFNDLKEEKGVYIIWNKTKNKHYVGQSKDMQKRLNQHFKNGEVNNIIFSKDWYQNDVFVFKYYICETKDELDALEKRYIEEYNSFENGYNSTGGNK